MSLGIYSFRLSVTTKSRRAAVVTSVENLLITQDDRLLLTQDLNNLALEQRVVFTLPTQSEMP